MPHAIEWSLATPKISAFRPSSSPIRLLQRSHPGVRPSIPGDPTTLRTMRTVDPAALRDALHGIRALLLDLDGVIVSAGKAVPGSVDAVNELERRGMPYRIVTNTSLVSRRSLSAFAAR